MTPPKTFPFYLHEWMDSEFVRGLNALQTGIYWKLLVFQAKNGSISSDLKSMSVDIDVPLWELAREWPKLQSKFRVGEDGRLRNARMQIAIEYAEVQYRKRLAQVEAEAFRKARGEFYVDDPTMQKILSSFPRRNGHAKEGFTKAMSMIRAAIHSDEDVEKLIRAIESYKIHLKKTYKVKEELLTYTKRIDRWMESWNDWVPDVVQTPTSPELQPVIEIPEFKTYDEELVWKRQHGMLSKFPPGSRFPWEPRYGAPQYELDAIRSKWTDEKKKEAIT